MAAPTPITLTAKNKTLTFWASPRWPRALMGMIADGRVQQSPIAPDRMASGTAASSPRIPSHSVSAARIVNADDRSAAVAGS